MGPNHANVEALLTLTFLAVGMGLAAGLADRLGWWAVPVGIVAPFAVWWSLGGLAAVLEWARGRRR